MAGGMQRFIDLTQSLRQKSPPPHRKATEKSLKICEVPPPLNSAQKQRAEELASDAIFFRFHDDFNNHII